MVLFNSSLNCLLAGFPLLTAGCHYTDSPDLQWRWRLVSRENIPEMEVHSIGGWIRSHYFLKVDSVVNNDSYFLHIRDVLNSL